ncbi:MAG TPA: prolipoprotein diacylglyceryl transferase [Phycisphaerae bacterium]|nr:prolipoprotein diacylglyceryl transferase [Phycisphaerae bacterium]
MCPTLFTIPWVNLPIRGYGLMLMVAFLGGTWWASRRAGRVKQDPDFAVNMGFVALLCSVVGARLFYVVHYWDRFVGRSIWEMVNLTAGGLEFYGGFIGAMVGVLAFMLIKRVSIRLYLDIFAPSLMVGMAAARIGCYLNGCCWGAPAPPQLAWAVQFPYASPAQHRQWEERMVTLPAELIMVYSNGQAYPLSRDVLDLGDKQVDKAQRQLVEAQARRYGHTLDDLRKMAASKAYASLAVHPAQIYASLNGLIMAFLLSVIFYRRRRHGLVFGLMMLLYPLCRIAEEMIRTDNPRDTAGLTVSQFVSVVIILIGAAWLAAIYRMPLRSPRATPFVWPPPGPAPSPRKNKKPH